MELINNACRPEECAYDLIARNEMIHIVTTVVGLIGGLVSILRFILTLLVHRILGYLEKNKK